MTDNVTRLSGFTLGGNLTIKMAINENKCDFKTANTRMCVL